MKKERRPFFDRQYLGRVAAYVAASVTAIGVLFYIGYHMSSGLRSGIDIMYARSEVISRTIITESYILKNESILENPNPAASPAPSVGNGERVRAGDVVSEIYTAATPGALARIAEIEEQIEFYENCIDEGVTVGDSRAVSRSISDTVIKLRRSAAGGDLSSVPSMKSDIILGIRELGVRTGRITDLNAQLATLRSSLASERAGLGNAAGQVTAPAAGYYFSQADGYESVFTSSSIDSLTYSDFCDMLCEAEAGPADISHSAGVLMSDFRWYIACRTDSVTASRLTEGQHYTVTLQNNGSSPIDMEYYRLLSNATDAVMIFKSMRIPENFDFTRCQNAVITYAEEIGYRIPVSAVRIYDGQEGVMILDHTKIDFRRIAVTGEENGYYLCSAEDPESPSETDSEESAVTAESYDTVSGGEADGITLYPYLQENDIVIKSGTGLSVGMTYDPKGN